MIQAQEIKREIEAYKTQFDFINCRERFSAFIGGIGSGKTFAGALKAIGAAINLRGLGLVVAPTYPMLRDATLRSFLELAGPVVRDFKRAEMRAEVANGAEVLFRSAENPDRLRNINVTWAWIDEAAICPKQTWEIVIGRLRAEGKAGPCWITTTPKGRNWVYERSTAMAVFRATSLDNPYLAEEFKQSLLENYTGAFMRQEIYAEFVSFDNLVYDEFDRNIHVMERPLSEMQTIVAGVDEGYTNPAVILVVGFDSDGRAHVIDEFYQRRVLQDEFVRVAQEYWRQYNISTFYVDPSAAGLIAAMSDVGLPVQAANNAVRQGIQRVKARLAVQGDGRPRLTVSLKAPNTITEFEMYSWAEDKRGLKDVPLKMMDHAMDPLRYVVLAYDGGFSNVGELFRSVAR